MEEEEKIKKEKRKKEGNKEMQKGGNIEGRTEPYFVNFCWGERVDSNYRLKYQISVTSHPSQQQKSSPHFIDWLPEFPERQFFRQ